MGRKLYVGNLGFDVNNKDLKDLFAQAGTCGTITDGGNHEASASSRWPRTDNARAGSAGLQRTARPTVR